MFLAGFFSGCGSRSSDFATEFDVANPLPPCPDSPNCVRITEIYPASIDPAWEAVSSVLEQMRPHRIEPEYDEYRIDSVFPVVFFMDDMVVQIEQSRSDSSASYIHIRSSSRTGRNDFGVNRKRVRTFLELLRDKE